MQDADRDLEELVHGDLEELVARIGVEDVRERLARVALRRKPCARAFTAATLRRSSGMSSGIAMYAVDV